MSRVSNGTSKRVNGILKQSRNQTIINSSIIKKLEAEERQKKNALNKRFEEILNGSNNSFKKSFKNHYNNYYKSGNYNRYIRKTIRALSKRPSSREVRFDLGSRI